MAEDVGAAAQTVWLREARKRYLRCNRRRLRSGGTDTEVYLVSKIGSPQPAYRGVRSLILRQVYIAANNPYMKPWAVRVKRRRRDWHTAKAESDGPANRVHVVYECLTNAAWGRASINGVSFLTAADVLFSEGFGLNTISLQQSTIAQFIKEIRRRHGVAEVVCETRQRVGSAWRVIYAIHSNYEHYSPP